MSAEGRVSATPMAAKGTGARWAWLDELRGVAVVLMIHTHALTAWLEPAARQGSVYDGYAVLFAVPSRLFLFLFGYSIALAARRDPAPLRRGLLRAGELFAYAFALRVWDWGTRGASDPVRLWKVDILNCMGALALLLAPLATIRRAASAVGAALALTALAVVLGALGDGFALPPSWPAEARAYFSGARPLAHFPLAPWAAYGAAGFAWATASASGVSVSLGRARTLVVGVGCAACAVALLATRRSMSIDATLLERESDPLLVVATAMAIAGLVVVWPALRGDAAGRSLLAARTVDLGRASLLVYFVHLGVCFGPLSRPWHANLPLAAAVAAAWAVVVLMAGAAHIRRRLPPRARLVERARRALGYTLSS